MTESGLPYMCYNPTIQGFEPYPHYVRMMADGLEAILAAYLYHVQQRGGAPGMACLFKESCRLVNQDSK